ncbi:MAG: methyltransferase [Rhodobacteraceae bacterium]|nr:methyltransferase [Paracoccaceae bacterium]
MTGSRLDRALEEGAPLVPPAGTILALGARAGGDLAALPQARTEVVQTFRPDHDALVAAGWRTGVAPEGLHAAAIVFLPRARAEARARIAAAAARLAPGGVLAVDGPKALGIDALLREVRGRAAVAGVVARGHGKLFWCHPPPTAFADWAEVPHPLPGGFVTLPGVFSADGPDPGSVLLARLLPARLPARVADLGAGWGWLAAAALARPGVEELHLVEAEARALDCARAAIGDPRARFHWADAAAFRPPRPFDLVLMNPPFHDGTTADPALGAALIRAAAAMLAPHGVLWLVANRHLPYEAALAAAFREVVTAATESGYKVIRAARPAAPAVPAAAARRPGRLRR